MVLARELPPGGLDRDRGSVRLQPKHQQGIAAFGIRPEDDPSLYLGGGYARIYGPDMQLKSTNLAPTQEGIVYADIDLTWLEAAKYVLDPTGHYARPDVFTVSIDRRRQSAVTQLED